jgi:hypothetical protein
LWCLASLRKLEEQPEWLKGGKLRDYQLEGLNFLVNRYVCKFVLFFIFFIFWSSSKTMSIAFEAGEMIQMSFWLMKWVLGKLFSLYQCLVFYKYSTNYLFSYTFPYNVIQTCISVPYTECPANPWSFSCSCAVVYFIKLGQRIQEVASWYEYYCIRWYSSKSRGETSVYEFSVHMQVKLWNLSDL